MGEGIVLGFFKKFFVACVSLADFNLLQTKISDKDRWIKNQDKTISDLKDELQSKKDLLRVKDEEIISLRDELIDNEAKAKEDLLLATNISKNLKEEKNALNAEIKILKARATGAEQIEKAAKEKLEELIDKFSKAGTDLMIANADKKAIKGRLDKAEVDLSILREKLEIEAARKEIKSSRGNSALKKDEVLRVVSLRESNKGIIAIAKEMDLTIDSVENILNGISYTRWTKLPKIA